MFVIVNYLIAVPSISFLILSQQKQRSRLMQSFEVVVFYVGADDWFCHLIWRVWLACRVAICDNEVHVDGNLCQQPATFNNPLGRNIVSLTATFVLTVNVWSCVPWNASIKWMTPPFVANKIILPSELNFTLVHSMLGSFWMWNVENGPWKELIISVQCKAWNIKLEQTYCQLCFKFLLILMLLPQTWSWIVFPRIFHSCWTDMCVKKTLLCTFHGSIFTSGLNFVNPIYKTY